MPTRRGLLTPLRPRRGRRDFPLSLRFTSSLALMKMNQASAIVSDPSPIAPRRRWLRPYRALTGLLGRGLMRFITTVHGLGAFALVTLGVMISKAGQARHVVRPLIFQHVVQSGLKLLPMIFFLAAALGLLIIGQTVSLLTRVGAPDLLGTLMVVVVVRELGPLLTALVVLSRIGTTNVIELGTARAQGEVESLEVMGIDPIHYLVVPRVAGLSLAVFALTVYLILGAVVSGFLWAFVQDVPITVTDYLSQFGLALGWMDFVLLAAKTLLFGLLIAIVTCYHGLAQPLRLEEISQATIRAVGQSVVLCVAADALFIVLYLIL